MLLKDKSRSSSQETSEMHDRVTWCDMFHAFIRPRFAVSHNTYRFNRGCVRCEGCEGRCLTWCMSILKTLKQRNCTHTHTHTMLWCCWYLKFVFEIVVFSPQVFPRAAFIMFILAKRWTGMKCGLYGAVLCRHKDGWNVKCWHSGVVWLMIRSCPKGAAFMDKFHQISTSSDS